MATGVVFNPPMAVGVGTGPSSLLSSSDKFCNPGSAFGWGDKDKDNNNCERGMRVREQ